MGLRDLSVAFAVLGACSFGEPDDETDLGAGPDSATSEDTQPTSPCGARYSSQCELVDGFCVDPGTAPNPLAGGSDVGRLVASLAESTEQGRYNGLVVMDCAVEGVVGIVRWTPIGDVVQEAYDQVTGDRVAVREFFDYIDSDRTCLTGHFIGPRAVLPCLLAAYDLLDTLPSWCVVDADTSDGVGEDLDTDDVAARRACVVDRRAS